MIKSYRQFNESKFALDFEESSEWQDVKQKHSLGDSTLKDYFTDLIDDRGFEVVRIIPQMFTLESGLKIKYTITFSRMIDNPTNKHYFASSETYLNFLNEQSEDLEVLNNCLKRIQDSEDLEIESNGITNIPFFGAGENLKENTQFEIRIRLVQKVVTNDLVDAKSKFHSQTNPARESLEKIIKLLEEKGVKEARQLVTTNIVEGDCILYGFLTDDEIIVVGNFYFDGEKLLIDDSEINLAVKAYKNGDCKDALQSE